MRLFLERFVIAVLASLVSGALLVAAITGNLRLSALEKNDLDSSLRAGASFRRSRG